MEVSIQTIQNILDGKKILYQGFGEDLRRRPHFHFLLGSHRQNPQSEKNPDGQLPLLDDG